MKKIVVSFLLIASISIFAQTPEKEIETQYLAYSQLIIDKNVEKALDYTNQGIFDIFSRAQIKQMMESLFNNPNLQYEAKLPKILEIEPIKKIDGAYYAKLKTENVLYMKILPEANAVTKSAKEQQEYDQNLFSTFTKKYGDANVVYDSKTGYYTVTAIKYAIANSGDLKNWKFVVIDNERMKPLLEKFLPKEMLE